MDASFRASPASDLFDDDVAVEWDRGEPVRPRSYDVDRVSGAFRY